MRVIIMFIVMIILCIHEARGGCNDYTVSAGSTLFQSSKSTSKVLRIGALGTLEAIPTSVPLLNFAVNVINNRSDILPDVFIELHVAYCNRSSSNALLASQTLIDAYNVSALIGALYSFETRISQLVSRIYQIPQIAATPLSTLLSNKIEYPYLVRVIPPDQYEAQSIADLFKIHNWKQAMVYYCDDEFGTYGLSNMVTYTKALNVTLYSNLITSGAKNFTSNIATVKQLVNLYNIKIFIIYTQAAEAAILLEQMRIEGMVGGEYISLPYLMTKSTPIPSFVGSVVTTPRGAIPGDLYNQFISLYKKYGTPVANAQEDPGAAWYYVDAVFLIAVAVDNLISSGKDLEHITGKDLLQEIVSSDFTGVTGRVLFDDTYDRVGDYVWLEITETGINLTDIRAIYSPITKSTTFIGNITWNGNIIAPVDGLCYCLNGKCVNEVCVCNKDYSGEFCETYVGGSGLSRIGLILVIVLPVLIVAAIIAFAVKYNYYKRNKMIKDISGRQRSVLKRSDITLKDRIGRGASGEVFRGMLRGTEVAVKKIVTTTSQEVASDFELECAIMAGLRHPNIVLFMGSCFVPDQNEMLLVMELMERGSLHDIIHNPKVQITREMLLHIAYQAAKGMNFLHQSSPPIIHRDLKSHNILMDDKWNARISDFGITKIKSLSTKKSKEDIKQKTQSLGTIYWTAPEVFEGHSHMEASDCYSFAIVLWEMLHRQTPYGGKEPMSVAVEVVTGVRPRVDPNVDKDIRDLMVECWAPIPEQRPNFETISHRLKDMMSVQGLTNPMHHQQNQIEAPTGSAYFVFTEIDGGSELWDEIPMVMLKSIEMHNKFIRSEMEKYSGYEVEFCQNGFFVAFFKLQYAMNFCLSVQSGLLNLNWPAALLNHPNGKTIIQDGAPVWAGLRVRMGLHSGVSNCEVDRATGRVTYFGPLIERTKKLLGATRINYPIVATSIIVDQCNQKGLKFVEDIVYTNCGETLDTTRSKMEAIYKIFPKSLVNRDNTSTSSLPHSTVMIEDINDDGKELSNDIPMTSRSHKTKEKAKWDVPHDALEEKEKVGRGSTGDFIHCMWNGTEVAAKVLLNQKVEEEDLLILKARASVLSKLKHKNLLDFYGVCLDPGHISVIVGYQPNSGLPSLIATSILTLKQKVKIARQIAEAMDYLVSSEHEWLASFALKSPNVLVIKDKMEVKLCDFGQGNLRDLARTMTSVGTVAWTAPEILEGDESGPSNKSTVYSFAIIMWEIMAQKVPYYDQHPIKVVNKILGGYRPPCPDDCPNSYRELMEQCWNADPNLRPNWSNILHQLDSIQN